MHYDEMESIEMMEGGRYDRDSKRNFNSPIASVSQTRTHTLTHTHTHTHTYTLTHTLSITPSL